MKWGAYLLVCIMILAFLFGAGVTISIKIKEWIDTWH
jgi:hypothetical protein